MAAYIELLIDQGATFTNTLTITDDLTNQPVNVDSYIVTSQLRRSYYSMNASANLACSITDGVNGVITMSMTAANTSLLQAGRYVFDVKAIVDANTTNRLLEGIVTVLPGVTR